MGERPTRRDFLRRSGAAAALVAGGGPMVWARRARARAGTLRIRQWTHFVPAFDEWFDRRFAREWGEKNGVKVVVDHVSVGELRARAVGEIAAQRGHDLFGFLEPPPVFEDEVVPMNDVVAECEKRFGALVTLAHKATYNPRTKRYFALADSWMPNVLQYRRDWWDDVGVKPETWDHVREGARKIKDKHGAPAGFGLAPEIDTNMMLRGLLWSYGAAEQDEGGTVTINSKATVEAIRLMTAIFKESMSAEVFTWDPSSNNRLFVSGRASVIQNAISAIRTAEKRAPEVARKTMLAPPPAGPRARLGSEHLLHCYVIWKFAENQDMAKKFLVDLVAAASEAFVTSEFCNYPAFAKAVPDLRGKLGGDKQNPQAYLVLADAEKWSAYPGYPGHWTPAIDETFTTFVIPNMFARAARGEMSPEDSARQAETEMKRIFARWAR